MKLILTILLTGLISPANAATWTSNSNTPPFNIITISSGTSYTVQSLNSLRTVLVYKSGASQAKTLSLKGCTATDKAAEVEIIDGDNNSNTYNITVTPTTGTINGTSSYVLNEDNGSVRFTCNGASNWVATSNTGGMRQSAANAILPDALNYLSANRYAHTFYAPFYAGTVSGTQCTWDSTHDVGDCINAASAAAAVVGGGEVIVPAGTFGQTVTVALADKVKVKFAGGANFGDCGSILKWLGSAGGTQVTAGSDAVNNVVAGTGLSGVCLDGNSLAAASIKWRSVNSSEFRDLYMYGYTDNCFDIDVSSATNRGNMFNDAIKIYCDGTQAASLTANVMTIGPGSAGANTNRNRFVNFTGIYQNGKGIICGNADSNDFGPAHIESSSGTPGESVHALGHASAGQHCRSNRFIGEFGTANIVASHFLADTDTFPSVNNELYLNHESGAPAWGVLGSATLWVGNNQGARRLKRIGVGGDPGTNNCIKYYGTTSGSVETCPSAVAGTVAVTWPATTGTLISEASAAWATYVPTVTCNAGTITTLGTAAGQYKQFGKTVHVEIQIPITTVGTCTGPLFVVLPVTPVSTTGNYHLHGREDGSSGVGLIGLIKNSLNANAVMVTKYDGTTCAASGAECNVGGTYQSQ